MAFFSPKTCPVCAEKNEIISLLRDRIAELKARLMVPPPKREEVTEEELFSVFSDRGSFPLEKTREDALAGRG